MQGILRMMNDRLHEDDANRFLALGACSQPLSGICSELGCQNP